MGGELISISSAGVNPRDYRPPAPRNTTQYLMHEAKGRSQPEQDSPDLSPQAEHSDAAQQAADGMVILRPRICHDLQVPPPPALSPGTDGSFVAEDEQDLGSASMAELMRLSPSTQNGAASSPAGLTTTISTTTVGRGGAAPAGVDPAARDLRPMVRLVRLVLAAGPSFVFVHSPSTLRRPRTE